jgi:hypothetical protein
LAYQSAGLGVDERWVGRGGLGRERVAARQAGAMDRIELKSLDYHERVRQAFLSLAGRFPERICLVDAAGHGRSDGDDMARFKSTFIWRFIMYIIRYVLLRLVE